MMHVNAVDRARLEGDGAEGSAEHGKTIAHSPDPRIVGSNTACGHRVVVQNEAVDHPHGQAPSVLLADLFLRHALKRRATINITEALHILHEALRILIS
jgi:hypothetical protein